MRLARYARKLAFVASVCALAELPGSGGSKPSALGSERAASNRQGALQIAFELASDFDSGVARIRENLLALVDERGAVSDQEVVFTHAAFKTPADDHFRSLSPAEATEVYAYIRALRSSYGRFQGAQTEGDSDWAAKQLKAAQEYADLLANSLIAEAQHDEEDVAQLRKMPFAVRRSPRDQAAFVQRLKNNGLPPEQLALMRESGLSEAEIAAFQQRLLQLTPDKIGASPDEMLSQIAASRRQLAGELHAFAHADPGASAEASGQEFAVGNPHDKQETIDLFIRRVSIPASWKLAIVNVAREQAGDQASTKSGDSAEYPVVEREAGRHYSLTLPAKAQVRVASVVVPVGEVGANTTARWAVEGKIGDELIGGMVHEMDVPYVIADLQLPPVGSKDEEELLPALPKAWVRTVAQVAAGILVMGMLVATFVIWRRRPKVAP